MSTATSSIATSILFQLKDLVYLVLNPKTYAAHRTLPVRMFFHRVFLLFGWRHVARRRDELQRLGVSKPLTSISEAAGFTAVSGIDPVLMQNVLQEARQLIRAADLNALQAASQKKYLVSVPFNRSLGRDHPFMRFALDPAILKMTGEYLGMLPVLENIAILYSPNNGDCTDGSQLYHLDGQDVRTLQIFVYIEDVDHERGPLTVIPADVSERLARKVTYRKAGRQARITDDVAAQWVPSSAVHSLTGPAGSVYVADTDRCFHYGSRKGSKPRFVMVFQYFTPFAFSVPWCWWQKLPFANIRTLPEYTRTERLVLGARDAEA